MLELVAVGSWPQAVAVLVRVDIARTEAMERMAAVARRARRKYSTSESGSTP